MAELSVALVSPDRELWSGAAKFVVARTTEGELGVLPGHEPVLGLIPEGAIVKVETVDGSVVIAAAHRGFLSVDSDRVIILAETAELAGDIDVARAQAALARARESMDDAAQAAAHRAEARLRAVNLLH